VRVLLDTCVLSELQRSGGSSRVKAFVEALDDNDVFISVLSIGEIVKGIFHLKESRRRRTLRAWLHSLEAHHAERILPADLETWRIWGEIAATAWSLGRTIPAIDGLLAATALRHGLHLATRNTSDFEPTGALVINPWVSE
jgi:predicted nucleic acid-binding protein